MNDTEMAAGWESRCTVKTISGGYQCGRRAGHEGFHETTGGYQWRRSVDAPATRYSCGTCGLTFPDIFGADQCCSPDPAHCAYCWDAVNPPRERWTFAGRGRSVTDGVDFYVWQLRNPDGTVNSSWLCPVSALLLGGE